jgi:archaellum biogenesis ATPase FlaH
MKTLTKFMDWNSQPESMDDKRKPDIAANDASFTSTEGGGGGLSDREVISLLTSSKSGIKAAKLYKGDMSAYEHDHSSAEMALMNYFVYYTQDYEQLCRLYYDSGLSRDKWAEVHSSDGRTYGEMTIDRAIDDCEHFFKFKRAITEVNPSSGFKLVHIQDVLNRPLGLDMVIDEMLPLGSLACIFGPPAGGKSFVALDMAFCVSQGITWNGLKVDQGTSIYIAGEGIDGIAKRLKALSVKYECNNPDQLYLSNGSIDLAENKTVQELLDQLKGKVQIKLIIIDTLHRNFTGDENSATDMAAVIKHADKLKDQTGATILIVHHSGKTNKGEARGSSALKAALDVEMQVSKSKGIITLKSTKMKDLEPFPPMYFKLNSITLDELDKQGKQVSSATLETTDKPPFFASSTPPVKGDVMLDKLIESIDANGVPISDRCSFESARGSSIAFSDDQKMILKSVFYYDSKADIQIAPDAKKPDEAKKKSFDRSIKELKQSEDIIESVDKYLIVIS